tara:strand:- start:509 stop:1972 length:1464 start_codon:yes stop_codon:yes gene_type:complete
LEDLPDNIKGKKTMQTMPNAQALQEKWNPILEHESMPKITDPYRRAVTAILLENQERAIAEQAMAEDSGTGLLTEVAPATAAGAAGFATDGGAGRKGYDPILISLIRRAAPNLMAYDIVGVQPMSGPTGLVFFLKSNYVAYSADGSTNIGNEALFDEALTEVGAGNDGDNIGGTGDAGAGTAQSADPFQTDYAPTPGMASETAEALGGATGEHFRQMTFTIDKTSVSAKSRALKAEYTTELAQDLKAIHGLDAEQELANILSTEILAEINREVVHTVNRVAKAGGVGLTQDGTWKTADTDGRWSVERYKSLYFQLEKEANAIAIETRRGRGNIIIGSANAISALSITGLLDANHNQGSGQLLGTDGINGNTFVGTLNGQFKVYVDPYFAGLDGTEITRSGADAYTDGATENYITVGYKGESPYDAGLFYCPYVPLQMVKTIGQDTFQPKIGFKTRYGILSNPLGGDTDNNLAIGENTYYRTLRIQDI